MTDAQAVSNHRPWLIVYLAFFVALSFFKAPQVLIEPRFWAEDGAFYFSDFLTLDNWSALLFVRNGNYQFLNNVLVWLATKVPLAHAPAVTTYGAYLVEALVVALIYAVVASYRVDRLIGLLLVAAWTLIPSSYETWASATNVQWVCSVSMLFVLVLPQESVRRNIAAALIWTFACGLTGVTSCMLAPGFIARAWLERSRHFAALAALLALSALIQLAVLKAYGVSDRSFTFDPRLLTLPMLLQTIFVPLFGVDWAGELSAPLREGARALTAFTYVAGLALMLLATWIAWRAQRAAIVLLILGMWALVSVLNTFGALGDQAGLIAALGGGRYYLFGAMCFCLLLTLGTAAPLRAGAVVATALLGLLVANSAGARAAPTWTALFVHGPSWKQELAKCDPAATCRVPIWPGGWFVTLRPQSAR